MWSFICRLDAFACTVCVHSFFPSIHPSIRFAYYLFHSAHKICTAKINFMGCRNILFRIIFFVWNGELKMPFQIGRVQKRREKSNRTTEWTSMHRKKTQIKQSKKKNIERFCAKEEKKTIVLNCKMVIIVKIKIGNRMSTRQGKWKMPFIVKIPHYT